MDSLIAVMLAVVLGVILLAHRWHQDQTHDLRAVYSSLARLQEQVLVQGALGQVRGEPRRFPSTISPLWFGSDLPRNVLLDHGRFAWIDVAPLEDNGDHPPDPVARDPGQAQFWYSPGRGVVRARVPALLSDADRLALYNRVNNSNLRALPTSDDPARRPIRLATVTAELKAEARVVDDLFAPSQSAPAPIPLEEASASVPGDPSPTHDDPSPSRAPRPTLRGR